MEQKERGLLDKEEAANLQEAKSLTAGLGSVKNYADGVSAEARHLSEEAKALSLEKEWVSEESDLNRQLNEAQEAESGALELLERALEEPHSSHQPQNEVTEAHLAVQQARERVTAVKARIEQEHRLQPLSTIEKTEKEAETLIVADKKALVAEREGAEASTAVQGNARRGVPLVTVAGWTSCGFFQRTRDALNKKQEGGTLAVDVQELPNELAYHAWLGTKKSSVAALVGNPRAQKQTSSPIVWLDDGTFIGGADETMAWIAHL